MLHDITKSLFEGIQVWPGDVDFVKKTVEDQGFFTSSVVMSLHTGTHMDAPAHRFPQGKTIDEFRPFILTSYLGKSPFVKGSAVLFRGPVTGETAKALAEAEVALVGTDSSSIDIDGSVQAHEVLLGNGIPVIENLDLSQIEPGKYLLLAFPVKISGADASPVRIILADSLEDIIPADWK
ncbi:hypothetical protein CSA37_11890 [Candidatus Fermentibacteria bacterium]|nr:MAG: hypothetical protein CSA37_11890 [Candidatus Fermentibacteria bacterium]